MADLDPTGGTIQLGDLGLRTPNLVGTAEFGRRDRPGRASARPVAPAAEFEAALDRAEMETTHVVEIEAAELPGAPRSDGGAERAGGGDAAALELDVPQPPRGLRAGGPLGRRARRHDLVVRRRPPSAGRAPAAAARTRTFTSRRTPGAAAPSPAQARTGRSSARPASSCSR